MGKIVAIGGGEIGRPGYPVETTKIDQKIIRLSGKKQPRLLFIPTASSDAEGYIKTVKKHFGQRLGCKIDTLLLTKTRPTRKVIRAKILNADIIYVGGGDTRTMLKIWKAHDVDKILKQAYDKGIILSGVSAGAVCWFKYANSDSETFVKSKKPFAYIRIKCLNFLLLTVSSHHIREKDRKQALITIMKTTPGIGLALDDYAALEIIDDQYRIISSKSKVKVYKVYYQSSKLVYKPIKQKKRFSPLTSLMSKV